MRICVNTGTVPVFTQKRITGVLGVRFPFPWALLGLADGASSEARAPETANHVNRKTSM